MLDVEPEELWRPPNRTSVGLYRALGEIDQARPCFFNFLIRCF
jgi:hypothetical protein